MTEAGKRESIDSAALDKLIEYANSARDQADSQFCVSVAEYERSAKEFEALVADLHRRPDLDVYCRIRVTATDAGRIRAAHPDDGTYAAKEISFAVGQSRSLAEIAAAFEHI